MGGETDGTGCGIGFGSEATKGAGVVLGGLAREELNSVRGTLTGWDKGRERWSVRVGDLDEKLLIKEDKVFMEDGHVLSLWSMWRAVFEGRWRGSTEEASSGELDGAASGRRRPIAQGGSLLVCSRLRLIDRHGGRP